MGVLSSAWKSVKGVAKKTGFYRYAKKVGNRIMKLGGKIMKATGIDKVINKLGPIGMIGISILVPYAAGIMAQMGGIVGTIGQTLQAVGTAVAAPFKAAGQAIGGAIAQGGAAVGQAVGQATTQAVGETVTSLTAKVGEFLGYQGGSISDAVKGEFTAVSDAWGKIATPSANTAAVAAKEASYLDMDAIRGTEKFDVGQSNLDDMTTQFTTDAELMGGDAPYSTQSVDMSKPGEVNVTALKGDMTGDPSAYDEKYWAKANKVSEAGEATQAGMSGKSTGSSAMDKLGKAALSSLLSPPQSAFKMPDLGGASDYGRGSLTGGISSSNPYGKDYDKRTGLTVEEAMKYHRMGTIV